MKDKELWEKYRQSGIRKCGKCPDFNELAAYIDGNLSNEGFTEVERHLNCCKECLETVIAMKKTAHEEQKLYLNDINIAENTWKQRRIGIPFSAGWKAAAVILFLLVARAGFSAGTQTYASIRAESLPVLENDLDEISTIFNENGWNLFDAEVL